MMTVSPVLQAHVEMIIVMYPKCTLVVDLWSHYLSFIVVTVGIEQTSYTILEANFLFTVNVVLLEGTLGTRNSSHVLTLCRGWHRKL